MGLDTMAKSLNNTLATLGLGLMVAWTSGCSETGGSGSFVTLNSSAATVNGQAVKAVQLTESGGQQVLQIDWNVNFGSPTKDYQTRVFLGTQRFESIVKLLELNCSDTEEGAPCGSVATFSCNIETNAVNCAANGDGNRAFIDQRYSQLLLEVCVYDQLFSDFDKNQCKTQAFQFAVFKEEDERLTEHGNEIPAEWVQNGVPGLELIEETEETEEEEADEDAEEEKVPLEENPLYITQQENLNRWTQTGLTNYLYTINTECDECDELEDVVVVVTDDQVSSAFYTPSGVALDAEALAQQRTINQWFEFIKEGIDTAFFISAQYQTKKGYPTQIAIDPKEDVRDDETVYRISELQ